MSRLPAPDKAIDNDTNGNYYGSSRIFHSAGTGSGEYLLVTLAGAYNVTKLGIFGRTDCCDSRDHYNFELLNGETTVGRGTLNTEIASHFDSVSFVPEPAVWGLMVGGFGLLGAVSRRRRTATVVTA